MIQIPGFKGYSFSVGCRHVRSFSVDSTVGLIADYVLGECGAPDTPFAEDYYDMVRAGDNGLELTTKKKERRLLVTRDDILLSERSNEQGEDFSADVEVMERARHIIPGIMTLLRDPNVKMFGLVWKFVKADTSKRARFSHPAAEYLAKRLLQVKLDLKEHPCEVHTKLSFRKQLLESWLKKGLDDFLNVNLEIEDETVSELWKGDDSPKDTAKTEPDRISTITVDVQRMFDPRRPIDVELIDMHLECANDFVKSRFAAILRELSLGNAPT